VGFEPMMPVSERPQTHALERTATGIGVGFEPTMPVSERPQTHALDRTATGIGVGFEPTMPVSERPKTYALDRMATGIGPGLRHLILEVSRTHTHRLGLLWTSDQLVAEAATCTTHNKHKRWKTMSSAGFVPAVPTIKRLQTYALDRTATGIGTVMLDCIN
jgi:hypothetical protein